MFLVLSTENRSSFGSNKEDLVNQVFNWSINDKGEILYKADYHYISMSPKLITPEHTKEERTEIAIKFLWSVLIGEYGYLYFKEIIEGD